MLPEICLFGAGGHGQVVAAQIAARWPGCRVVFADGHKAMGDTVGGIEVVGSSHLQDYGMPMIITVGNNALRARLQAEAGKAGVAMASFVADETHYFTQSPGPGSMVLAGTVVSPNACVGRGVIINNGAVLEHDCNVGDFCHLAPSSTVTGGCNLGSNVLVGAGAVITNQANVVSGTVIGAGATVTSDITEAGVYVGTPSRHIEST